jgi:tetratricopeptide (TPR) repeat protein
MGLAVGVQRAADSKRAFCAAAPEKLTGAWELPSGKAEGSKHATLRRAFLATGKSYAPDAVRGVVKLLDDYASKWAGLYKDACEATHVRGEQSSEVLDLRMDCLNDRLSGLRALTDVFGSATGEVVEHAVDAAHALTPLDGCSDIKQLKSLIPPPDPAAKAKVEGLRKELGQIKAVHDSGRYLPALESLKPIVDEARRLGYRPLEAEAMARIGTINSEMGRNTEAEKTLESALEASVASHHDDLLPEISAWLVWVVGFQGRFADTEKWRRFAEATIERTSGTDSLAYSWLLNNVGVIYQLQGRFGEALEYQRRARSIKERSLGPDDPDVAVTLGNVALALNALGRSEEALEVCDRSLQIRRRTQGDSHPRVADELSNRGEILANLGRATEALTAYQKALEIWQREFGPEDLQVAYALTGIGRALVRLDRPHEARLALERALAIRASEHSEKERLGETEFALANALLLENRDLERARSLARQALVHYGQSPAHQRARSEIAIWIAKHGNSSNLASRTRL